MDAVGFSESAPPLYYALAWVWTQLTGTGEFGLRSLSALAGVATVPVAYLLGAELRGRRAGIVAAALVAVNPMLLWYSQEAAPTRCCVLLTRALAALLRARARPRPPPRLVALGRRLGARPRHPLLRRSSRSRSRRSGCCAAAAARRAAGLCDRRRRRPRCWRRWRSTRCRSATPNGSATHSLGHRLWETGVTFAVGETGDIIAQPGAPAAGARAACSSLAGPGCCSSRRGERERAPRGAAIPLALAAVDRRRAAGARRCSPRQGLRPRPQPAAGAGAAAGRGRDRRHPARRPPRRRRRRRGCWSPTRWASALGQRLAGAAAARLGRGRRRSSASRGAAGDGHLDPGRGLAALLPLDRLLPGPALRRLRLVRRTKSTSSPTARRRRRRAGCSARASARSATSGSAASTCGATRSRARPGAAAAARGARRRARLPHATASSSTASARADAAAIDCELS